MGPSLQGHTHCGAQMCRFIQGLNRSPPAAVGSWEESAGAADLRAHTPRQTSASTSRRRSQRIVVRTICSLWSSFRACLFPGSSFKTSRKSVTNTRSRWWRRGAAPVQTDSFDTTCQHLVRPPPASLKPAGQWPGGRRPSSTYGPKTTLWCSRPLPPGT